MPTRVERAAQAIAETKYIVERELRENKRYRQMPISDFVQDASAIIAQNIAIFLAEVHNEGYRRGERTEADYPRKDSYT